MSKIPRRASRNIWQRIKRWWQRLWYSGTVIRFDESSRKGMIIAYRYPDEKDIKR